MCDVSVGVWTWTRFTMLLLSLLLCLSSCRSRAGFVTSASVTRVTTTEDAERNEDTVSVTEALDTGTSDPGPGLAPRLAPDQPRTFTGLVGQRADMEVAFCEDAGNGTASLEWSVAGVTLHPGTWYTPSVEGGMGLFVERAGRGLRRRHRDHRLGQGHRLQGRFHGKVRIGLLNLLMGITS